MDKQAIVDNFKGNFFSFYSKFLPKIKKSGSGDEYQAVCPLPGHEDRNPSFSFNNTTGQFHCHGCKEGGDCFSFYALVKGLPKKGAFPKILEGIADDFNIPATSKSNKPQKRQTKPKPQEPINRGNSKPEVIYPYEDITGELLFEVVRFPGKNFAHRRPRKDGKPGYHWNLEGIKTPLMNLRAVAQAQETWLAEGEKDAVNLNLLGLVATTAHSGGGRWESRYTETLAGKDIIFCADNDEAGAKYKRKVTQALHGKVNSLKVLPLDGHKDISDFLVQYGKLGADHRISYRDPVRPVEILGHMVADLPAYHPIQDNPLKIETIEELLKAEIPDAWLVENLISAEECGFIAGGPKWGKSIFAQNLAMCMAGGHDFLCTFPMVRPLKVLYMNMEISRKNLQRRFQLMQLNSEFTYPPENLIHLTHKGLKLDKPENFISLEEQIAYHRPDVVILDCLYMVVNMSLNQTDTTAPFLAQISKLIEKYKITVLVIHHYRKPSHEKTQRRGAEEMLGSMALHAYGDFYLTFKQNARSRKELTLEFEMRNCREPDRMKLIRNDETLWYEFAGLKEEDAPRGGMEKGSKWDVVDILKANGGQMSNPELVLNLERKLDASDKTARKYINEAKAEGYIGAVNPSARPLKWQLLTEEQEDVSAN